MLHHGGRIARGESRGGRGTARAACTAQQSEPIRRKPRLVRRWRRRVRVLARRAVHCAGQRRPRLKILVLQQLHLHLLLLLLLLLLELCQLDALLKLLNMVQSLQTLQLLSRRRLRLLVVVLRLLSRRRLMVLLRLKR